MKLKEMIDRLEELEDEYYVFKMEMINAIIESERAMHLMCEKESEIMRLKQEVEFYISHN